VESQRRTAEQRSAFEQASSGCKPTWPRRRSSRGVLHQLRLGRAGARALVEKRLATDLQKAGSACVGPVGNSRIGSSILRFVERIEEVGHVIVIGTPSTGRKRRIGICQGSVVAGGMGPCRDRMLATEDQKRTVLPVLLAGENPSPFQSLLRGRVYATSYRRGILYEAFDLILDLYDIHTKIRPWRPARVAPRAGDEIVPTSPGTSFGASCRVQVPADAKWPEEPGAVRFASHAGIRAGKGGQLPFYRDGGLVCSHLCRRRRQENESKAPKNIDEYIAGFHKISKGFLKR